MMWSGPPMVAPDTEMVEMGWAMWNPPELVGVKCWRTSYACKAPSPSSVEFSRAASRGTRDNVKY
jgi:hypothetical protein